MDPHHLLLFFPRHQHQRILSGILLLLLSFSWSSSCEAIATMDKEINSINNTRTNTTLSVTSTSIKHDSNESTFPISEDDSDQVVHNLTKSPSTLLGHVARADLSSALIIMANEENSNSSDGGGRQARASGWVWSDPVTAAATSAKIKNAPPTKGKKPGGNGSGKSVGSNSEGRGYYTFGDWTTQPYQPSTTISNACVCVPYYLCDEGEVVTIIDIRHGWGCNSVLEVCCRNPRPTSPPDPTPVPPFPIVTVQPGFVPQCGTLNVNGVNARILGFKDSQSQYGEYPFMGAVLESKLIRGKWVLQFVCGASLITPRVMVTAGHCVKGKRASNLIIRLGEWDTQSTSEFYPYQDLKVSEFVVHPQFYSGGLYNDIALVFLQSSAILAPHIDTVCLPRSTPLYDPSACFATGWGKNAFGPAGQYQAILREVELAVTPSDECQTALRTTNLGPKFNLHSSFICAGGQKDLDTCVGDGGGPLVCPSLYDPWRYVLIGIVSWGVKCGTYGVPGVYTSVPKFRSWIDSEISQRIYYNASRWTLPLPPQGG